MIGCPLGTPGGAALTASVDQNLIGEFYLHYVFNNIFISLLYFTQEGLVSCTHGTNLLDHEDRGMAE
jgi:hypothetical protein